MSNTNPASSYQRRAMRTRGSFRSQSDQINFSALEIGSEAGEVVNVAYKHLYQSHPFDIARMIEELGDLLWGVACMCDAIGIPMEEVMDANIRKLLKRYPNGFNHIDSMRRVDHDGQATEDTNEG